MKAKQVGRPNEIKRPRVFPVVLEERQHAELSKIAKRKGNGTSISKLLRDGADLIIKNETQPQQA